jgi:hypothetical protein
MLYLRLIILSVGDDVPVDRETLLVTDFMKLKIKPTQYFRGAHRGRVCVSMFIELNARMYEYLCLYCIFKKRYNVIVTRNFILCFGMNEYNLNIFVGINEFKKLMNE